MPTLFRLVTTILLICAVIYGIMAALVHFVEPTRRELTVEVPILQPQNDREGAGGQP